MTYSTRALLLALSIIVVTGCKRTPTDTLAPVRRTLERQGLPLATRTRDAGLAARTEALRTAAESMGPLFVLPIISDRVSQLGTAMQARRDAEAGGASERTWVALSSDGSVFTAIGGESIVPFTRPFREVEVVRAALVSGASGRATIDWPASSTTKAFVDVAPVRVEGAIAGALVVITPYASEAARIRDAVRRGGAALARVEICLRETASVACTDVPPAAQRAVTRAAFGGPNASATDFTDGALRGVLASGAPSEGLPRIVLWTPAPRR